MSAMETEEYWEKEVDQVSLCIVHLLSAVEQFFEDLDLEEETFSRVFLLREL